MEAERLLEPGFSRPEGDYSKCLTIPSERDDNTATKAARGNGTRQEPGTVAGIAQSGV